MCCVFKQRTAYDMRISDLSSDDCSSDLKLGFVFLDSKKGKYIYLAIQAPDGLKEGTYSLQVKEAVEDGVTAYLTLDPDKDLFPESFDTKIDLDGDFWNDGTGRDRKSTRLNSSH